MPWHFRYHCLVHLLPRTAWLVCVIYQHSLPASEPRPALKLCSSLQSWSYISLLLTPVLCVFCPGHHRLFWSCVEHLRKLALQQKYGKRVEVTRLGHQHRLTVELWILELWMAFGRSLSDQLWFWRWDPDQIHWFPAFCFSLKMHLPSAIDSPATILPSSLQWVSQGLDPNLLNKVREACYFGLSFCSRFQRPGQTKMVSLRLNATSPH
jgi:hypothetical protein